MSEGLPTEPLARAYGSTVRRLVAGVLVMVMVLLGGCGGDDEPTLDTSETTSSTTSSSTSSTTSTTAVSAGHPDEAYTTGPVTAPAPGKRAILTSVRVSGHAAEGYDRVVFEFREGQPGYTIAYAEGEVVQDGSGDTVAIEGSHTLEVRLEDAADFDENGKSVFTGPRRIKDATTSVVLEAAHLSSFEGVVGWGIGTNAEQPFFVELLSNPTRLVIDIKR